METITLDLIYKELINVKQNLESLRICVHEDLLELSEETKRDIEESQRQIKPGQFVHLEEL